MLRETGWSAALSTLAQEGVVVHLAALQLFGGEPLTPVDCDRLALACARVSKASLVLAEREAWKPDFCFAPLVLVRMRLGVVDELQRQLDRAQIELKAAEAAVLGEVAA